MGDRITAMLAESGLPLSFWGHCLASMVHVWNRLPTAPLPNTTPFEAFYKCKPDVSHFRVWGCTAYVHIQRDKRNSLQPHAEKCVFIGYPTGYKGWLFYNPTTRQTRISEQAEFDERYFPCLSGIEQSTVPSFALQAPPTTPAHTSSTPSLSGPPPLSDEGGDNDMPLRPTVEPKSTPVTPKASPKALPQVSDAPEESNDNLPYTTPIGPEPPRTPPRAPTSLLQPPPPPRRSSRNPAPRRAYWLPGKPFLNPHNETDEANHTDAEFQQVEFAYSISGPDPRNYKAAMSAPDADRWKEACNTEILTLIANGTWELVELPQDAKVVQSGWVFKVKLNPDNTVERYCSRLVAKGYSQRPGYDYTEVFAPTFRPASLRLIIALAAKEGLKMRSVDISSAFTYGELDEVIYMKQPEGYHQGGPKVVCKLHKSLYGLKQSARQ